MKYIKNGFSLIEVLVSMAVMATGLLAVASFQTDLLSNSGINKARSEALALAQQRIEEFRNYTLDVTTQDGFDTEFTAVADSTDTFPDGQGGTTTVYHGNNANFTRKHTISGGAGAIKTISVAVSWSDRRNEPQSVSLNTQIGWESPRKVGDLTNYDSADVIPSATGRARLGDGELDPNATTEDNGDGTKLWEDGDDLKLAVGDTVVLTLDDACQTQTCTNFVRINGKIYIDVTSTNKTPGDIYVKASDAAYCHRYYVSGTDADGNDITTDVTANTTSAQLTANGNYHYFNYTCYLGGGWHGNIGILVNGGISQSDKICQGDPTSDQDYADPVISARRVYRGMSYKTDANGDAITIPNSNGLIRYYSIGIKDETVLPDPDDSSQKGHDFVISSMATSDTEGEKCVTATNGAPGPMMRTDSEVSGTTGALFAGIPTDWVCLNDQYIDTLETGHVADSTCPFDPSDPPVSRHVVAGTVSVLVINDESLILDQLSGTEIVTSDGAGNCTWGSFTQTGDDIYSVNYICDVYDWGSGWTGYIGFLPNSDDISCTNYRLTHSAVEQDLSAQNFSCSGGDFVIIRGTVDTVHTNKVLSNIDISDANGVCSVSASGLSYECRTSTLQSEYWTGTLTFHSTGGVICNAAGASNPVTVNYNNYEAGSYENNLIIKSSAAQCGM